MRFDWLVCRMCRFFCPSLHFKRWCYSFQTWETQAWTCRQLYHLLSLIMVKYHVNLESGNYHISTQHTSVWKKTTCFHGYLKLKGVLRTSQTWNEDPFYQLSLCCSTSEGSWSPQRDHMTWWPSGAVWMKIWWDEKQMILRIGVQVNEKTCVKFIIQSR